MSVLPAAFALDLTLAYVASYESGEKGVRALSLGTVGARILDRSAREICSIACDLYGLRFSTRLQSPPTLSHRALTAQRGGGVLEPVSPRQHEGGQPVVDGVHEHRRREAERGEAESSGESPGEEERSHQRHTLRRLLHQRSGDGGAERLCYGRGSSPRIILLPTIESAIAPVAPHAAMRASTLSGSRS